LFVRCHAAFKTASGLAAAGQAAEAYVMHRSMLEYAAYALHINRNPELAQVWLAAIQNHFNQRRRLIALSTMSAASMRKCLERRFPA
jgi:hypothetical protein